jgi:UDP-glucose:glycoprotein glucosyltransferase
MGADTALLRLKTPSQLLSQSCKSLSLPPTYFCLLLTSRHLYFSTPRSLPFDRILGTGPEAILYSDLTSSAFGNFHKILSRRARDGEISYRLRYKRPTGDLGEALPINGYGVELALKKTDYIVIDDREAETDTAQKLATSEVDLDSEEEVADLKPLSTSELGLLGLKTASYIMQSEKPFETLIKITQDFPKFSTAIGSHNVSAVFMEEYEKNRVKMIPTGINVLWMNGVQLIERQIEPLALIDMLRTERTLIGGVKKLGLTGKQAVSLLSHPKVTQGKGDDEPLRFDWRDQSEDGRVIIWLNDLENDQRYEDFPTSLMSVCNSLLSG